MFNFYTYIVGTIPLNDNGQFVLDTDASDYAIGAVLSQVQNWVERVIAYGSRALSKALHYWQGVVSCEKLYSVLVIRRSSTGDLDGRPL